MALLNAGLLWGLVLVGVPVVLHLTLRQRPKRLIFPAIQWVKPRLRTNQRQLHWKQWLLLAMRCAVIALLAFALARPAVASAQIGHWLASGLLLAAGVSLLVLGTWVLARKRSRALAWASLLPAVMLLGFGIANAVRAWWQAPPVVLGQQAPVAAVFVFDTSPRMGYLSENRSRLAQAAQIATEILRHLPPESTVATLDSQTTSAVFSLDPAAVAAAVKQLRPCFTPRPWPDLVRDALELLSRAEHERKELYLFSDLNRTAWSDTAVETLRRLAETHPLVSWYLIDVGVDNPRNVTLGLPRLSAERVPRDGELVVQTTVSSLGIQGERIVELLIEPPDPQYPFVRDGRLVRPEPVLRGTRPVTLEPGSSRVLEFRLQGLPEGTVHGQLRISGEDGLAVDDVRYFTVQVQQAWPVLLAAPADASLRFIAEALAPYELREQGHTRFDCMQVRIEDLASQDLRRFAAVVLADPPPMDASVWRKLLDYVTTGGGLAVFLGHQASSPDFNLPETESLLGVKLTRVFRSGGRDVFLAPHDLQHPVWRVFRESASSVPWHAFPVFRHWGVAIGSDQVRLLAYYSNGEPALLEHPVGQGKVLLLTTPLSDTARPPGRMPWNEFVFGEDPWPQFVLLNEMLLYLVATGEARFNVHSGESVTLPLRSHVDPDRFQVFPPTAEPYQLTASGQSLLVRFTDTPGHYDLKGRRGGIVHYGFSVNVPEELTDLKRADPEAIFQKLGKDRLQPIREVRQIERAQGRQRVGREFYPMLMTLLVVLAGLEYAFANRFYRRRDV
ncbi:MAG: hypothetical protein KatS3mg110_1131 [Pirellulaceae bacterium]|nr:MAG: hypothetical protein KatS3mg110_1131 [Pirellulaceae bacterium]